MTITQTINETISCSEVVREYLGEPQKTAQNYDWYKCPFHTEKTASMRVFHEIGKGFYCEGCHVGGSAVNFVERYYKIDNLAACKKIDHEFALSIIDKDKKATQKQLQKLKKQHENKARCVEQLRLINDCLCDLKQKLWNETTINQLYTTVCELEFNSRKFTSIKQTIYLDAFCKYYNHDYYQSCINQNNYINDIIKKFSV